MWNPQRISNNVVLEYSTYNFHCLQDVLGYRQYRDCGSNQQASGPAWESWHDREPTYDESKHDCQKMIPDDIQLYS